MRVAIRVGYDGRAFRGSQRQPHGRTVEDRMLGAMRELGILEDPRRARFQMAARTDAGVSAVANVAVFDTEFPLDGLLPALAGRLDAVWPWALAEAPDDLVARRAASWRTYTYTATPSGEMDRARAAFAAFEGRHDLRGFCKRDPKVTSFVRRVHSATLDEQDGAWVFEVRGDAFLWQQVRRMVGAALAVARGDARLEDVQQRLRTGEGRAFRTAPPEPLVLTGVGMDLPWRVDDKALARGMEALGARIERARLRARTLAGVRDRIGRVAIDEKD